MKEYPPLEFSLQFNPNEPVSMNFRFPTAPAYLSNDYNQKCKVEFVSAGVKGVMTASENTIYIVFKGISSNQYRLLNDKATIGGVANTIRTREFVNTPLSAIFFAHDDPSGTAGKGAFNNGNIITNGNAYIVTDAVWGKEVNLELRETVEAGTGADPSNRVITPNTSISLVMRITPFSEGC